MGQNLPERRVPLLVNSIGNESKRKQVERFHSVSFPLTSLPPPSQHQSPIQSTSMCVNIHISYNRHKNGTLRSAPYFQCPLQTENNGQGQDIKEANNQHLFLLIPNVGQMDRCWRVGNQIALITNNIDWRMWVRPVTNEYAPSSVKSALTSGHWHSWPTTGIRHDEGRGGHPHGRQIRKHVFWAGWLQKRFF